MNVLLAVFIAGGALAQTSYVPPAKLLKRKGYQLSLLGDYWTTAKLVDESGKSEALPEGSSFSRFQSEVAGYYGATNDLQFGLGLRYRQNRSEYPSQTGESISATGTGVQATYASIKFAFPPVEKLQYTLEGLFTFVPYSNEEFTQNADDFRALSLGDEGNQLAAGLAVTYTGANQVYGSVRGGYRKAGSHVSDELYYQVEAAKAWRYVALSAGVDGVASMKNDPYGAGQDERPYFWSGTTRLYHQENREYIAPYAGLNVALGPRWRVELRGTQVVAGRSTDLGTGFSFALVRREDASEVRLVDSKFKTYDLEATVTKISPEQQYVVIDKGLADDVHKGMRFDFFEFDYVGGNVLVASGVALQVKSDSAIVKITQRFTTRSKFKDGMVGRASLR